MKKVIGKKLYDTGTATLVAKHSNGRYSDDAYYEKEELYVTNKGKYFLYTKGGGFSKYSQHANGSAWGIEVMNAYTVEEAFQWSESVGATNAIEKYFPHEIEEA